MINLIKNNISFIGIVAAIILLLITDIAEAQNPAAVMHRRTRRRTAIVVSSVTHEKDKEAQEQKEAQEKANDQQVTDTTSTTTTVKATTTPTPTTESPNDKLPIGSVVSSLPQGCVSKPVNNVEYYQCGPNYYKVAYQGSNLVYVTVDPPE